MSLQQLRSFVEVYRCLSISEAARNLELTQPAVSQHLAVLETQIGRSLFERHVRGVRATSFADDLAGQIGDSLDRAEGAFARMKARSVQLTGTVHIAGPAEMMAEFVSPRLSALRDAGLQLRIHFGGRESIYALLTDGKVDLAFTASEPNDSRLAAQSIGKEKLIAVAAPQVVQSIVLNESLEAGLRECSHIAYDQDRPLVREWCTANNVDLKQTLPAAIAPDLRVLRTLLKSGDSWSVLPDYLCEAELLSGELKKIPGLAKSPENQFNLVWNKVALRHPRIAFARQTLLEQITF